MEVDICELITLPRIEDGVDASHFFDISSLPFETRIFRPVVAFGGVESEEETEGGVGGLPLTRGLPLTEGVILGYLNKLARNTEVDEAAAVMENLSKMKLGETEVAQRLLSDYDEKDEISRKLAKEAAEYLEMTYRKGEKEREVLDKFLNK